MFELVTNNFVIIMPALWAGLGTYALWYLTKAQDYSPITREEARTLWYIHHRALHCGARRWRKIKREGQIIGFQCECGYKHLQKRPLVAHSPSTIISTQTDTFDKMHTTHH